MTTLRRLSLPLVTAALMIGCGDDGSSSTGTTATATGSASASTTATSTSDTTSTGSGTATDSGTASDSDSASGSSSTSGDAPPPICAQTTDCAAGLFCLRKPCDVVMDAPGCGEFRCYSTCSEFIGDSAQWNCADDKACCGGYPCDGGYCTESFETG